MINTDLLIRQAKKTDAEAIMTLIHRAMTVYASNSGIPSTLESMQESLADIVENIETNYVLIAKNRDGVVGTVRLIFPSEQTELPAIIKNRSDRSAWFSRFAVLPELHAAGVGRLLYQAAEDYLHDAGADTILLYTALRNLRLVNFYQARGFSLIDKESSRGYERGLFVKNIIKQSSV